MPGWRRLGSGVLAVALSVALFLVLGEGLARLFGIVDRLNGYGRVIFVAGPDADLPYRLRPNVETDWLGTAVRVNALGLRGPALAPTASSGTLRLLVLGDSVVFGQGVSEEEAVTGRLAAALAGDGPVEVLNAGVQGYDTIASARMLELLGAQIAPHFVVFGMSLNDYDHAPSLHPLGVLTRSQAPSSMLDHSEFALVGRWLLGWARGALWYQQVATLDTAQLEGLDALVQREHLSVWADPAPDTFTRFEDGLRRMRAASAELGVPLLVAIFPESYQLTDDVSMLAPQRRMHEICRTEHLRCLDLQPVFAQAGGELFLDVQHPNARGHAVAARAIATALTQDELLR